MLCRRSPEFGAWLQRGPREGVVNVGGREDRGIECGGGHAVSSRF